MLHPLEQLTGIQIRILTQTSGLNSCFVYKRIVSLCLDTTKGGLLEDVRLVLSVPKDTRIDGDYTYNRWSNDINVVSLQTA